MKNFVGIISIGFVLLVGGCFPIENSSETLDPNMGSLVETSELDSLEGGNNGGVLIQTGIDDNGNGQLEESEVDDIHTICHGTDGAPGADGADVAGGGSGTDDRFSEHIPQSSYQ